MMAVLSLVIMSAQFTANGAIPAAHTCEGADTAPPLHWSCAIKRISCPEI